jgi:lipopolysaccharide transport system ATP-binding protein
MSEVVIGVHRLGKRYRLHHQSARPRYTALRDVLSAAFTAPFRKIWRRSSREGNGQTDGGQAGAALPAAEDFWALQDVSFEIRQGEVIGIIGRNGAGKSTLLKLLSRITEPTEGSIRLRGRVASLLEVGTGFHPELTGRENIFLNGAILGMTRTEIRRKFDEIVAFAEVEKFLDTPVKYYSSGMYVRLAFAVAAHLEPEILVVDEVLAVGDAEFQNKCLGKMEQVSRGGRTVLFVSHNMAAVQNLCRGALLLEQGRLKLQGEVNEVVAAYLGDARGHPASRWTRDSSGAPPPLAFQSVVAELTGAQPNLRLQCQVRLRTTAPFPRCFIAVDICDAFGTPLMQAVPAAAPFLDPAHEQHDLRIEIDLPPLVPGRYSLDFWVGPHYDATIDYVKSTVSIEILASPMAERTFPHYPNHGFLVPASRCTYQEPSEAALPLAQSP